MIVLVVSAGCVAHVDLHAPPPSLTADERVAWFQSFAAADEITTTRTCRKCFPTVEKELRLHNGTRIHAAEDLAPLVEPSSPTAQHARASMRARENGEHWRELAAAVFGAALITAVATDHVDPFVDRTSAAIWGPAAVVALFATVAAYDDDKEATREAGRAFGTFTQDLASRLDVCVRGLQVAPCEHEAVAGR